MEKRNKRLTVALTMTVVAIAAVVTMTQTDKLQAEVDEILERRLNLKIKQARQRLKREEGKFQSRAATSKKDAVFDVVRAKRIMVTNDAGEVVVGLGANDAGYGLIETYQPNGKELVQLNSTVEGHGIITPHHSNGNPLVALGATVDGEGMVAPHHSDSKMLVTLGVNDNGGAINVLNKPGEGIAQMHADEYGNGVVAAYNRKGKGRTLQPGP